MRGTTHTAALGYYTHNAADARHGCHRCFRVGAEHGLPRRARRGRFHRSARDRGSGRAARPIALDMGSGIVSMGKLMQAQRTGKPLARGGRSIRMADPTTDPRAATIPMPLGGAKGSGLALMIECLTSLVTANPILAEVARAHGAAARATARTAR